MSKEFDEFKEFFEDALLRISEVEKNTLGMIDHALGPMRLLVAGLEAAFKNREAPVDENSKLLRKSIDVLDDNNRMLRFLVAQAQKAGQPAEENIQPKRKFFRRG